MIGSCGCCSEDEIEVTEYMTYPDDPIKLCEYCENTSASERKGDIAQVLPRMLRVLEKRIKEGR